MTGEEIEIRYAHEVVYDEAHNLHLEIFTPFQMAHPERTWPCITFIQGSAWMKQYVYQKVGMTTVIQIFGGISIVRVFQDSTPTAVVTTSSVSTLIITVVLCVVLFLICRYILSRRLNLS